MNSRLVASGRRRKPRNEIGKSKRRILYPNRNWRNWFGKIERDQCSRRAAFLERGQIARVAKKRDVALLRIGDGCRTSDRRRTITLFKCKLAAYEGGQLLNRELHVCRKGYFFLPGAGSAFVAGALSAFGAGSSLPLFLFNAEMTSGVKSKSSFAKSTTGTPFKLGPDLSNTT